MKKHKIRIKDYISGLEGVGEDSNDFILVCYILDLLWSTEIKLQNVKRLKLLKINRRE